MLGDLYNADPARRGVCWSALRWCERLAAGRLDRLAHRFPDHVPSRVLAVADAVIRQCTEAPFPRNGATIVTVQHTVLLARAMAKRADHVQRTAPQPGYGVATVYRGETYDGDRWAVVLQGGEP